MSWEAFGDPPEYPCDVCGAVAHNCICPECPVCGEYGQAKCYEPAPKGCGQERSEEQIASAIRHDPNDDYRDSYD